MYENALVGLFRIDELCDLEMYRIIGFVQRGLTGPCDKNLDRRHLRPTGGRRALQHREGSRSSVERRRQRVFQILVRGSDRWTQPLTKSTSVIWRKENQLILHRIKPRCLLSY